MNKYCFAIAAILTSVTLGAQSPAIEENTDPGIKALETAGPETTTVAETPVNFETTLTAATGAAETTDAEIPAAAPAPKAFRPSVESFFEMRADAKLPKDGDLLNVHLANLYVNAQLTGSLSFHWRVRFTKWLGGQNFINSSDFLYLKWQPFEHLRFKAGRDCLYIGGYEYEQAPIDIFYVSEFCNNVAPYKFTATVDIVEENDIFGFQVGETPFGKKGVLLSAMWTGNHGFFESLWSLNAGENLGGGYSWLIGLGNKFHLTEDLTFFLDYTDRLHGGLLKDFSIVPKLTYRPCRWLRTRLEGSIDYNDSGISNFRVTSSDLCEYFCSIPDEFRCINAGIQFEFFPFKPIGDDLRLHASYNFRNTHSFGSDIFHNTTCLNLGVTYKLRSRR